MEQRGQKFSNLNASNQRSSLFPTSVNEKPQMKACRQKLNLVPMSQSFLLFLYNNVVQLGANKKHPFHSN